MTRRQLWWRHARAPLIVFGLLSVLLATTRVDFSIARTLFFDAANLRWVGAGNWWVNDLVHRGGGWFVRGLGACAIALCIASSLDRDLRALRRPAVYFVMALALSTGIVGLLKALTNIDCPWDLTEFGGRFPFVELFADRPDDLRRAQCFPAAHASSGYALLALYFVFRERSVAAARLGLGAGIVTGLVFGIAQQSRGAHFLSHDVWSVFLVWMTSLTIYAFAFRARLWDSEHRLRAGYARHDGPVAAGWLAVDGHADVRVRAGGLAGASRQRRSR